MWFISTMNLQVYSLYIEAALFEESDSEVSPGHAGPDGGVFMCVVL